VLAQWTAERTPLENLKVGQVVKGLVTSRPPRVFVDIGAVELAQLDVAAELSSKIKLSEEISGMKVTSINVTGNKLVVGLEGTEAEAIAARPAPEKASMMKTKTSSSEAEPRTAATGEGYKITFFVKDARKWDDALKKKILRNIQVDGMAVNSIDLISNHVVLSFAAASDGEPTKTAPVQSKRNKTFNSAFDNLGEGSLVDGKVASISYLGVFVDAGMGSFGLIRLSPQQLREVRDRMVHGEEVRGLRVDMDDKKKGLLGLRFDDAALAAILARPSYRRALEEFKDGDLVDGFVVGKNRVGTFVDIGCTRDARLDIDRVAGSKFALGEKLAGLRLRVKGAGEDTKLAVLIVK